MKDMVPKGTGNSRFLKSVSNFMTLYPTYADFVAALVAGTLPIDLNGINSAGCDEVGTPLNKANLMTDATFAKMGVTIAGSEPTVNDALDALAEFKAGLNSYGKVLPDQLSSRVVFVNFGAAGESMLLEGIHANTCIVARSDTITSGTCNIIVPDNLPFGMEFEVILLKNSNQNLQLAILPASATGVVIGASKNPWYLADNEATAVLKMYRKDPSHDGDPYDWDVNWTIKGDAYQQ